MFHVLHNNNHNNSNYFSGYLEGDKFVTKQYSAWREEFDGLFRSILDHAIIQSTKMQQCSLGPEPAKHLAGHKLLNHTGGSTKKHHLSDIQ